MSATKKKDEKLGIIPRISDRCVAMIREPGTRYFGVCILQAPGAWSRLGPTWRTSDNVWICAGPGLGRWNTRRGLAEISQDVTANPEIHATGVAMCPKPNLVFEVSAMSIEHLKLEPLEEWATGVMG